MTQLDTNTAAALRRAARRLTARFDDARRPGVCPFYAELEAAVADGRTPGDWPTLWLADAYWAIKTHLGLPRFGARSSTVLRAWIVDHTTAEIAAMLNATADRIDEARA